MKYEIVITFVANRKPKLSELNDFLFCRIRDNDLKYTINTKAEPMELKKEKTKNDTFPK